MLRLCLPAAGCFSHSDLTDLGNQNGGLNSLLGLDVLAIMISIFLFAAKVAGHYLRRPGPSGVRFQPPSIGRKIRTRGSPNKNTGQTYSKRWQDKYFFLCLNNWAHGSSELFKNCGQLVSSFVVVVFSLEQCLVWSPWICCHCSTGLGFARNAHIGNTKCSGTKTIILTDNCALLSNPMPVI